MWRASRACSPQPLVPQEELQLRESLQITVESEPENIVYKPARSFAEAGFPPNVLAACRRVLLSQQQAGRRRC